MTYYARIIEEATPTTKTRVETTRRCQWTTIHTIWTHLITAAQIAAVYSPPPSPTTAAKTVRGESTRTHSMWKDIGRPGFTGSIFKTGHRSTRSLRTPSRYRCWIESRCQTVRNYPRPTTFLIFRRPTVVSTRRRGHMPRTCRCRRLGS
jgi:hypothetical protein